MPPAFTASSTQLRSQHQVHHPCLKRIKCLNSIKEPLFIIALLKRGIFYIISSSCYNINFWEKGVFDTVLCSVCIMVGLDFDMVLTATVIQINNNNSLRTSNPEGGQNVFYTYKEMMSIDLDFRKR